MSDEFKALRARLEKLSRRKDDLSEEGKTIARTLAANLDNFEATLNSPIERLEGMKKWMMEHIAADLAFIEADLARADKSKEEGA